MYYVVNYDILLMKLQPAFDVVFRILIKFLTFKARSLLKDRVGSELCVELHVMLKALVYYIIFSRNHDSVLYISQLLYY